MKRLIALLLAVMMVAALFVGCNNDSKPTEGGETTGAADATGETTPATTAKPGEIPTITWYSVGNGMCDHQDSWQAKVNELLEKEIGVHLDYQIINWGDWGNKSANIIASGEDYDIMFRDYGDFPKFVHMGAFMDLKPLMPQVPGLTDLIPQSMFDAATVEGHLYGIPTYKDSANTTFFHLRKDVADKYCPNGEWKNFKTHADFTDMFRRMRDDIGTNPIITEGMGPSNRYDDLGLGLACYGIDILGEGAPKILETYRTEHNVEHYALMHSWIEEGIMNGDGAVRGQVPSEEVVLGGGQGWPSAWAGRDPAIYVIQQGPGILTNGTILGSVNCISANSKHPLEALKLLEFANTNTQFRDMLVYGEEGVDFEYVDVDGEKRVHRNPDYTWGAAQYTQATFFNITPNDVTVGNPYVDEILPLNEAAIPSPALGFYADTTELDDKLAEMRAIFEEYKKLINSGSLDHLTVCDEMYGRLDDIGAQEVIAELQRQLDEWYAAKNG